MHSTTKFKPYKTCVLSIERRAHFQRFSVPLNMRRTVLVFLWLLFAMDTQIKIAVKYRIQVRYHSVVSVLCNTFYASDETNY